jgi:hypothetical protein
MFQRRDIPAIAPDSAIKSIPKEWTSFAAGLSSGR